MSDSIEVSFRWGNRRFWIDETMNGLLAVSERFVAARGHSNVFVWNRGDGSLRRTFPGFPRPSHAWLDDEQAMLCLRNERGQIMEFHLDSGDTREREPQESDPEAALVTVDRSGYKVAVYWPEGPPTILHYPNQSVGTPSVALTPERFAIPVGNAVKILERDGRELRSFPGFTGAALSPDGLTVALGSLSLSRIFLGNVATGEVDAPDSPLGRVQQLSFSPDGTRLLVNAGYSAWILDRDGGTLARLAGCPTPRSTSADGIDPNLRWSPDGRRLLGSAGHRIAQWDAESGAVLRTIEQDPRLRVERLAADQEGSRAATVSFAYPGGLMFVPAEHIDVWDIEQGAVLCKIPFGDDLNASIAFAPDGRTLAIDQEDQVRLVELPPDASGAPREVAQLAVDRWHGFQQDGLHTRWVEEQTLVVERLRGGLVEARRAHPFALSFARTRDHASYAVGYGDGRIEVISAEDFSKKAQIMASGKVEVLALSPDGTRVVAGGWDATVEGFVLET